MRKAIGLLAASALAFGIVVTGSSSQATATCQVIYAGTSWQNTGNFEKVSRTDYANMINYDGYGDLNRTRIRILAKIGGDYTAVYAPKEIHKDSKYKTLRFNNAVNAGKLMRFCYKLPQNVSATSDKSCVSYYLY